MKKKNDSIPKKGKRNVFFIIIALIHAFCILMAAHLDLFRRSEYSFARANNICYWLWISTWWCIWGAWLTIIWAIYKLIKKNQEISYFEQLFDLTVLIANLLMFINLIIGLGVYYLSNKRAVWIYTPDMDNPSRTIKLFNAWEIKTQTYFWFNTTISHTFPALLILYYFFKHSKVNLLKKHFKLTLIGTLINPVTYFLFVILREKASNYWTHPGKLSYDFPRNYPMGFFYRCMGQQALDSDINYSHSLTSRFLWILGTFFTSCIVFFLLSCLLIKLKGKFNQEKIIKIT